MDMQPPIIVVASVVAMALFGWNGQAPERSPADPLAFVMTEHIHGVPYTEARALGPTAAPMLIDALGKQELGQWRSNIVVTLGFLGDPRAVEPLKKFLEATEGEVDDATFDALLDVPTALGDIARSSGDPKGDIVLYLDQGSRPSWWQKSNVRWFTVGYEGERLYAELASRSIAGLGRVASRRSVEVLKGLIESLADPTLKRRAGEAIELSNRIQREGPAATFTPRPGGAAVQPGTAMPGEIVIRRPMTIVRHVNVRRGMTDADADNRLSRATALLQRDDRACPDEVGCAVALVRSGTVGRFGRSDDGLDVIDDDRELAAVLGMSGELKVVRSIKWCNDDDGIYAGCSRLGVHNTIVIARASEETLAHEFGHTTGIDDRSTKRCAHWIMASGVSDRKAIDRDECACLQSR